MKKTATSLVLLALLTGCGRKPKSYTDDAEPAPVAPVASGEARKAEPGRWAGFANALTDAKEEAKKAAPAPKQEEADPDAELRKNAKDLHQTIAEIKKTPPTTTSMKQHGYTILEYELCTRFQNSTTFNWAIITFEPTYLTDAVTGKTAKVAKARLVSNAESARVGQPMNWVKVEFIR